VTINFEYIITIHQKSFKFKKEETKDYGHSLSNDENEKSSNYSEAQKGMIEYLCIKC